MQKIPFSLAVYTLLGIIALVLLFHGLVVLGVIPYDMVWGGRLTSREEMIRFEVSSVFINLLMGSMVAMKARLINPVLPDRIITIFLWVFVVLFALNTIGNLLAFNSLETYIFTPVTFISSVLFARVAMEKN